LKEKALKKGIIEKLEKANEIRKIERKKAKLR
jgi:hypothetical protein